MKNTFVKTTGAGILVALCWCGYAFGKTSAASKAAPPTKPKLTKANRGVDEECLALSAWFPHTPKPMYPKPNPESDCDFYKKAWQNLLYATQPERPNGPPRLFRYATPDALFRTHTAATATQRFPALNKITNTYDGVLRLAPRIATQGEHLSLPDIRQAGSKGILVDQNGRAIYYGVHLNNIYVDFIKRNGYSNVLKLKTAPADQEFPRGTVELKSSWQIATLNEDTSRFFTTTAIVSKLKKDSATQEIVVDPKSTERVKVKLVGLHVVFVMDGHPEFIWATFEHVDNAPDLPKGADPRGIEPVDDMRIYTFYPKGKSAKDCNKKATSSSVPPLTLNEGTQVFAPSTYLFREFAQGGETDPHPNAIDTLNDSVHAQLPSTLAVWKNYVLVGAVWLNNPGYFYQGRDFAKDDEDDDARHAQDPAYVTRQILGGDKHLSNSTIETFTQHSQSCFDCHRTVPTKLSGVELLPAMRLAVSQSLVTAYVNAQQTRGKKPGK